MYLVSYNVLGFRIVSFSITILQHSYRGNFFPFHIWHLLFHVLLWGSFTGTVNQLLFTMTSFRILPGVIWFAVTNFHDQDVDYLEKNIPETFKDWLAPRNICNNEALANVAKFTRAGIKFGIQLLVCLLIILYIFFIVFLFIR